MFTTKLKLSLRWAGGDSLGDLVKLPLFRKLPPKRVSQIWRTHYAERADCFGASLSRPEFERLAENAKVCRFFALPLRRDFGSFVTFFVSFPSEKVLFLTPLNNYLSNSNFTNTPSNEDPFVLARFYDELKESHDLVLAKVAISNFNSHNNRNYNLTNKDNLTNNNANNSDKLVIGRKEATNLFEHVLRFYLDLNRFRWVETFNRRPREFDFTHFLKHNNDLFHIF